MATIAVMWFHAVTLKVEQQMTGAA